MNPQYLESEILILKNIGVLSSTDSINDIVHGSYLYNNWAEHFWRRRKSHAKRPDPEITYIAKANPGSVLEVGCAYGRFTRKILELNEKRPASKQISVTGIEINPQFEQYREVYMIEYPLLNSATYIFDDVLNSKQHFPENSFDLVVIPMHTFPNFTIDFIRKVLPIITYLLTPNGECIFSTGKLQNMVDNPKILFQDDYAGSFDLEKGETPMASIAYSFPAEKTEYGYRKINYIVYYTFNSSMKATEKVITRSIDDKILPNKLEEILNNLNFSINYIEEEQFSMVHSVTLKSH